MFYLCNRSGLRSGEAAGLRMSDMAFVDEGRVRFSYDGRLKEDKKRFPAVAARLDRAEANIRQHPL